MKNYECHVGIDVSKLKLDVSLLISASSNRVEHFIVPNSKIGIQQMLKRIEKLKISTSELLVSFEDTGVYSLPLACFLSEAGLDYWMIPAIEIKRSKGISRGKNDKTDSKDIAFYAVTHQHKLVLSKIPEKDILELKVLITERDKVVKAINQFKTTSENQGFMPEEVLKSVLKVNKTVIAQLQKALEKLEAKMKEIIKANEQLSNQYELITSVPGVGPQTAMYMIAVTKGFKSFENWRKMACYAGVAPFEYSSGSSIRGRTKVNHLADKKMKSLLNLCALNAKKFDKQMVVYYENKVAEGKSKMLVINNVRCKLLARIFSVVKRGTPFVDTYKFAA
jgi:transposase